MENKECTYKGLPVELNKNCVNKKIEVKVLEEQKMREIGFTDFSKDNWYFCKYVTFPKNPKYKHFEISFGLSIPKNNPNNFRIDVLDEDFCQPYDYQSMLERNPKFEAALLVQEEVEKWMKYLEENGILSGHIYGEYI